MARVLIIGFGNPLRRDDGFGWHVAHALRAKTVAPDIEVIACHQLTPDLAEPLSRAQYGIFIDAVAHGAPGSLSVHLVHKQNQGTVRLSHHSTPQDLVAGAEAWYGSGPRASYLVSVSANDFGFGENMSDHIAQIVPLAIQEIEWLCAATHDRTISKAGRAKKLASSG